MGKKRKSGDGSVHLRKDGRWEGRYVVGYNDKGYPKTKNVLAKTKRECIEKLNALKSQYETPKTEKLTSDMPFGDWLDYWYQNYVKDAIRPATQQGYENSIYRHIIPEMGAIPLNKLSQNDLQQFYVRLKQGGRLLRPNTDGKTLSDRSVRACHLNCHSALEKAVEQGLLHTNPADGCKLPPKKAEEMQVLTREEMQRFLIQAKAEGYYELFLLELATGLRRGELLALQWSDLNLDTGELRVSKQINRVQGKLLVSEPKTKASIRTIILPRAVVDV
ncbi:MAG: site-specific integrase, partial [Oscillospiraceae bacterium]|nr:site-specific integrase [Oscillospiraceae bacterium]